MVDVVAVGTKSRGMEACDLRTELGRLMVAMACGVGMPLLVECSSDSSGQGASGQGGSAGSATTGSAGASGASSVGGMGGATGSSSSSTSTGAGGTTAGATATGGAGGREAGVGGSGGVPREDGGAIDAATCATCQQGSVVSCGNDFDPQRTPCPHPTCCDAASHQWHCNCGQASCVWVSYCGG